MSSKHGVKIESVDVAIKQYTRAKFRNITKKNGSQLHSFTVPLLFCSIFNSISKFSPYILPHSNRLPHPTYFAGLNLLNTHFAPLASFTYVLAACV